MFAAQEIAIIPDQVDEEALSLIGHRAMSRYKLTKLNLPVPPAFVITSKAFYTFLNHDNGLNKWRAILENAHAFSPEDMVTCSQSLQRLILHHPYPDSLSRNLFTVYNHVMGKHWAHLTTSPTPTTKAPVNYPLPVIKGESALLDFLRQMWSAQLTPYALSLHLQNNAHQLFEPAPILVSQFEPATASGTIVTVDTQSQNKQVVRIEAIWGTNPQTDPHAISPDIYIVNKTDHSVLSRVITTQKEHIVIDRFGQYRLSKVDQRLQEQPKLNAEQLTMLTAAAIKVHDYAIAPQVINWLMVNNRFYFTRFQPFEKNNFQKPISISPAKNPDKVIATGLVAAPGIVTAPVIYPKTNTASLTGRIAIYKDANPQLLTRSRQAAGIIIESGGLSSELAVVARETGIPTLVGVGQLSIQDGQTVILDALHGVIKQNTHVPQPLLNPIPSPATFPDTSRITTATHIYLNLCQINSTQLPAYRDSFGVGMCRGTDILCQNRIHPKQQLKHHPADLSKNLMTTLQTIAETYGDRPVYYQPYDLDTVTASKLMHGDVYEPSTECNPLIGFRGAFRLMNDSSIFQTELTCLATLRHRHNCTNISLLIPLLRSVDELVAVKQHIAAAGLYRSSSFQLIAEIGTPAAVDLIPQWAEIGLDGFLLNLDMLAALVLGYDPNAAEVDQCVDVNQPTVLRTIHAFAEITSHVRLPMIAVGYQLDQNRDTLEAVIQAGMQAISISPARFEVVKPWVSQIEAKIASTKYANS